MKKCLLVLILLILVAPAQAQEDYRERLLQDCNAVTTSLDTSLACEEITTCLMSNSPYDCIETIVIALIAQCNVQGIEQCEEVALIYEPAFDIPDFDASALESRMRNLTHHISGRDYENAVLIWEAIFEDGSLYPYYVHYASAGALQVHLENYEQAIKYLTESIAIHGNNPFAYYFRAKAYDALEQTDLAERDAYRYEQLASDELQEVMASLDLTFEAPELDTWIAYPFGRRSGSPVGAGSRDLSFEAAFPVQLAYLDEGDILLITSLTEESIDFGFYTQSEENPNQYVLGEALQGVPGGLNADGTYFILTIYSDFISYELQYFGAESSVIQEGVLFPDGEADPRINLERRVCEGLPLTNIVIGDVVDPPLFFDPEAVIRTGPEMDAEVIDMGSSITVVDGPTCTEEFVWWEVSTGGETGWIVENSAYGGYIFMPRIEYGETRPTMLDVLGLDGE